MHITLFGWLRAEPTYSAIINAVQTTLLLHLTLSQSTFQDKMFVFTHDAQLLRCSSLHDRCSSSTRLIATPPPSLAPAPHLGNSPVGSFSLLKRRPQAAKREAEAAGGTFYVSIVRHPAVGDQRRRGILSGMGEAPSGPAPSARFRWRGA